MRLQDVAMLVAPNHRTKAYLQRMVGEGIFPAYCILMSTQPEEIQSEAKNYQSEGKPVQYFDPHEPIGYTLEKNGIAYHICPTHQVNDPKLLEEICALDQSYIIYSGFAGQILKKELLNRGKKFLHIHPGIVPDYRGSTTIYYSLLREGKLGATAMFLNENIDQGEVIAAKEFDIPSNPPNLDYILDPYLRSVLLVEVLKDYEKQGRFITMQQEEETGETYFIIHPVLKHVAILREIETKRVRGIEHKIV